MARPWRRLPKAARILVLVPAVVELAYLILANAFLNFNILPIAFAGTNQVRATVQGGWTIIPQRVHVRQVRVIFQDHNLQFSIDLARGFLVVHLTELLHQRFHASHLRGEGIVFRLRNRVDPWAKHDPEVTSFPPIPEYPAPAVYEAYVPGPLITDAQYNLWSIYFDDVDVATSELWAQAFRYRGRGRARGAFELRPARRLWVGPATLELEPGLLTAGAYRVAAALHGRIDCTVHPFDPRWPVGVEPLRYISARVRLDSVTLDPQVYALLAGGPAPQVTSASGSLHLDVETRRGLLAPGSRLDVVQNGLELRTTQGDLSSERLELHASAPGESGTQATLLIARAVVKESIAPGFPPHIEQLSATVLSNNRDTTKDFDFKEARVDEARLTLRDASWLNRWVEGGGFALAGGGASIEARGRYVNGFLNGDATLETDGLSARLGKNQFRYTGALSLHVTHADPKQRTGDLVADLAGRALRAEVGEGEFSLAGLQVHALARRDASGSTLHGEAKLSALSSTGLGADLRAPQLTLIADSEPTRDGTQLTHFSAVIPALTAEGRSARLTTAASARGTFAHPKNSTELRLNLSASLDHPLATVGARPARTASAPRVQVDASLESDASGALSGAVSLLPAAWRVDSGNMRFSGRSALNVQLTRLDLARHAGSASARLSSTGVTLGDTTQNAACPWSRVQVLQLDALAQLSGASATAVSIKGQLGQTELNWGTFTTRADIGLAAKFDQGALERNGDGILNVSFRNATLRSGTGSPKEGWAARMGSLDLEARLAERQGQLTGTAALKASDARGRIGGTRVTGDLEVDLKLDALDFDAHTLHSSGALHVRNAALPDAADPVSKWWADIQLSSLYGHAADNLELGGTFHASLRDATPGLAVLAEQGALPKWVASAFPLRDLSITGSLARRCRLTDIHLVELSGGPAVARGRLQSVPSGFQGALLLRVSGLSAISAGLDFDATHTHVGLFDGDDWLAKWSESFDRQSERAVNLVCPPDVNLCADSSARDAAPQASGTEDFTTTSTSRASVVEVRDKAWAVH